MNIRIAASALALALAAQLAACSAFIPDRVFEERLRETLREHPDIVLDALAEDPAAMLDIAEKGVRARRDRDAEADFRAGLAEPLAPALDGARVWRGTADAPVTIVAYSHFFCGFCARGSRDMHELLLRHPGEIRFVAKHAPNSEDGEYAARLFEALALQGMDKAWAFYDDLFAVEDEVRQLEDPQARMLEMARALDGVDSPRLDADLVSEAVAERVKDDVREFNDFGFRGVPVYLFNGVPMEGAMSPAIMEKALGIVLKAGAVAGS